MAEVKTNKSGGGVIRWDASDWLAGLVPDWDYAGRFRRKSKTGLAYADGMDPTRNMGYLVPGFEPSDVTNNTLIDATAKAVVTNGDKAYIVANDEVHELDISIDTITNAGAFPHTISGHGHASFTASDIAIYSVGTTKYAFYSWNDSTDGDVGRYDLSSTFDDDYMSAVAASGAVLATTNEHPMLVNSRNILLIGDGNKVHAFDGQTGASGTFSSGVLVLEPDYVVTSMVRTRNYTVVYAYRESESGNSFYRTESTAFFWDNLSTNPTYVYDIPANFVNGGFVLNGTPGCFGLGQNSVRVGVKLSKMLLFSGATGEFETIHQFGSTEGADDGIPYHGGVQILDNMIVWNAKGKLYQFGSPFQNTSQSVNKTSLLDATSEGGFVSNLFSTALYASAGNNSLQKVNVGYYPGQFFTVNVTPPTGSEDKVRINSVKVYWKEATGVTPNTLDLHLAFDDNGNTVQLLDGKGNAAQPIVAGELMQKITHDSTGNALTSIDFNNVTLYGTYTAGTTASVPPILEAVEVYFESVRE